MPPSAISSSGRAREQQEQRVPVLGIGVAARRQLADQPFVQQRREFADRGIGRAGARPSIASTSGWTLQRDVAVAREASAADDQPGERAADRGMRAG